MKYLGLGATIVAVCGLNGCLQPSFDLATQSAMARSQMRRKTLPELRLFYAQNSHQEAILASLQPCLQQLRRYLAPAHRLDPAIVALAPVELNNAYVTPPVSGQPQHMVLPQHEGLELFNLFHFGALEVGAIACHEAVHNTMFQSDTGINRWVKEVFGDLNNPAVYFDSWFHEGMATFYEGKLTQGLGRPHSKLWRGMFAALVAARRLHLNPGDLSDGQRQVGTFGGNYLVGMHFVEYLAKTYGEPALWEVVRRQGKALWSPFAISLRFRAVYGKSLGGLFDDFNRYLAANYRVVAKPAEQVSIQRPQATWARLATCPQNGSYALVSQGLEDYPKLTLQRATGRQIERHLVDILPRRERSIGSTLYVSGLSFSGDCNVLFFTYADLAPDTAYQARIWQIDIQTGQSLRHSPVVTGIGGGISPDGQRYVFAAPEFDGLGLWQLADNTVSALPMQRGTYRFTTVASPQFSRDGDEIVFSGLDELGYNLYVRDAGGELTRLTHDSAFNYAPVFVDKRHLIFLRGSEQGTLQGFLLDRQDGSITQLTHAPYALLDPQPLGAKRLAFLNAESWLWSVDTVEWSLGHEPAITITSALPAVPPAASAVLPPASVSDVPYRAYENMGWPRLRLPYLGFSNVALNQASSFLPVEVGGYLLGQDHLGFHRYALQLGYNPSAGLPNAWMGYLNMQLAPLGILLQAAYQTTANSQLWSGSVSVARPFGLNSLSLGLQWLDTLLDFSPLAIDLHIRSIGLGGTASYVGAEYTPYAGVRRQIYAQLTASYYPPWLSNASFVDTSANIGFTWPLPLSKRHTMSLLARGRMLWLAPPGSLQLGGLVPTGSLLEVYQRGLPVTYQANAAASLYWLRNNLGLVEPMWGYEDQIYLTNQMVNAMLSYTYPLIIDRGFLAVFYVLPSLFFRQINFTLFATSNVANLDAPHRWYHRACGAMVSLQTILGRMDAPSLAYRFTYRFDETLEPFSHFVMLGL